MPESNGQPARTLFVTVVAWLGILAGTLTLLVGAAMAYVLDALLSDPDIEAGRATLAVDPQLHGGLGWIVAHPSVVFLVTLAFGAAVFAVSVAMLRRRNWGRLGVLATLWLGIAVSVAGAALTVLAVQLLPPDLMREAGEWGIDPQRITWGLMATVVGAVIIIVALHAWIIQQLMGADTRREFGRT